MEQSFFLFFFFFINVELVFNFFLCVIYLILPGNSHDHLSEKWGLVRLTGTTEVHTVISSHHEIHLKFVSDETVRKDGFLVGVSPLNHTRIASR